MTEEQEQYEDVQKMMAEAVIPPESQTPQQQNLLKTLEQLAGDLEIEGWDKPARIYFINTPEDDPALRLMGYMGGFPPDDLLAAYAHGVRVDDDALGLVVASEGVRHLYWEELLERKPDMISRIQEAMKNEGIEASEEQIEESSRDYYYGTILPQLPAPMEVPEDMRSEVRTLVAVMRDGHIVTGHKTRGKPDFQGHATTKQAMAPQSVPTSMYLFLHGLQPDPNHPDPVQAVEDYLAIKDLEKGL